MLAKRASRQQINFCFNCALNHRKYHQGHASGLQNLPVEKAEELEETAQSAESLGGKDEEVRRKLNVSLGALSEQLGAFYSNTGGRKSAERNSSRWKTILQTFDVRFNRDSLSNATKDVIPKSAENVASEQDASLSTPGEEIAADKPSSSKPRRLRRTLKNADSRPAALDGTPPSEELVRSEMFRDHLAVYINNLVELGELDTAAECLHIYILNRNSTSIRFKSKFLHKAQLPNIVLREYAIQGRIDEAISLYNGMVEFGVTPDTDTYIWLLYAACQSSEQRENTAKVLNMMSVQGVTHQLRSAMNSETLSGFHSLMSRLHQTLTSLYPDMFLDPLKKLRVETSYNNLMLADLNHEQEMSNAFSDVLSGAPVADLVEQQLGAEAKGHVEVTSITPAIRETKRSRQAKSKFDKLQKTWKETLTTNFNLQMEQISQQGVGLSIGLGKLVHCIPADSFVEIMLQQAREICQLSEHSSPPVKYLARMMGEAVHRQYVNHTNAKYSYTSQIKNIHMDYMKEFDKPTHPGSFSQIYSTVDRELISDLCRGDRWPPSLTTMMGERLYDIMIKSCFLLPGMTSGDSADFQTPAFYSVYRFENKRTSKEVKPHPKIVKLLGEAQLSTLPMPVQNVPTFVPPVPWKNQSSGSLLQTRVNLVRSTMYRHDYYGENCRSDILPFLDAVNVLASVPWAINNDIYDCLLEVYNKGGDKSIDVPISRDRVTVDSDCSVDGEINLKKQQAELKKLRAEAYSLRMSFLLGMSVANYCKDRVFWLPYNADFRGRLYPFSSHLGPVSDDPRRSLLKFAKGKPLGARGLEWLKIHLVNLSGLKKKESNASRLAYAEEVLPLALQSAASPLEGDQWWRTMDSPWQGLSACLELKAAYDSGDPTSYLSTLPIHQDGSCNGLQHYAAMGLDCQGAASVNVVPADSPHDTYSDMAAVVELRRAKDAADGNKIAQLLEGKITRKVVKQSVMTKVYGVTRHGALLQVKKHLSDQEEDMDKQTLKEASLYISTTLLSVMADMFKSSTEIQNWLTLCAHLITSVTGKPLTWKTPLGLTVTQNYWSPSTQARASGSSPPSHDGFNHDSARIKPNVQKHKNGFPPNFVHSLDSTHMMMTALRCQKAGIAFTSIHDCFWTHAADVDTMNKICRDAFYDLYKQPILEDLSAYFLRTYVNPSNPKHKFMSSTLRKIPSKGKLDLKLVKQSEYFFS